MTKKHRFLIAMLATMLFAAIGRAETISISSSGAGSGESGHFDVLFRNLNPFFSVSITAFTFDILFGSPDVTFTGASTSSKTALYIFAGDSFVEMNGLPLATKTGQELIASDVSNDGKPFAPGIASLGEVFYSVAPTAPLGPVAITFSTAGTSLSDGFGTPVTFGTVNGEITVSPEPVSLSLLASGLLLLAFLRRRSVGAQSIALIAKDGHDRLLRWH